MTQPVHTPLFEHRVHGRNVCSCKHSVIWYFILSCNAQYASELAHMKNIEPSLMSMHGPCLTSIQECAENTPCRSVFWCVLWVCRLTSHVCWACAWLLLLFLFAYLTHCHIKVQRVSKCRVKIHKLIHSLKLIFWDGDGGWGCCTLSHDLKCASSREEKHHHQESFNIPPVGI